MPRTAVGFGTPFFHRVGWYVKRDGKAVKLYPGTPWERQQYAKGDSARKSLKAGPEVLTALAKLVATETGLIKNPVIVVKSGETIADLMARFLPSCTRRLGAISNMYRTIYNSFVAYQPVDEKGNPDGPTFGQMTLDQITPEMVENWIASEKGWQSGHTQRLAVKRVRQFINWAMINREIKENPIKGMRLPEEPLRQLALSKEEITTITTYTHPRFARYFRMCLLTGRRPGEIASLKIDDVDTDTYKDSKTGEKIVCLKLDSATRKSKTGSQEDRFVPLVPEAAEIVKQAIAEAKHRGDEILFPSEEGCQYCEQSWNRPLRRINEMQKSNFNLGIRQAKEKTPRIRGEITMYFTRFQWLNNKLKEGMPIAMIAKLAGNSVKTILKYYESSSLWSVEERWQAAMKAVG